MIGIGNFLRPVCYFAQNIGLLATMIQGVFSDDVAVGSLGNRKTEDART